ncbi:uncharacterized protein EAF02_008544 [Botrytis sinoallii]|uniref:uncharacterized protein n=1 Tax=Botrytis sinoallii TaxID=1463999 RepID=UPI0019017E11|nr:uncharacterized protein EAF02_008544 [Botrytis sinoallii]KAF7874567.1 hypothetical protein EAF02_008544 [Botrytis sinoallii]
MQYPPPRLPPRPPPPRPAPRSLGQNMAHTIGVFQALIAFPVMIHAGVFTFWCLTLDANFTIYEFVNSLSNAFFSASILFIIITQRGGNSGDISKEFMVWLEVAKSGFASAVWLWLLFDSIFGPVHNSYNQPQSRTPRIAQAIISFLGLPFLFYSTLAFAIYDLKTSRESELNVNAGPAGTEVNVDEEAAVGERSPLLSRE